MSASQLRPLNRNERVLGILILLTGIGLHQRAVLHPLQARANDASTRIAEVQSQIDAQRNEILALSRAPSTALQSGELLKKFDQNNERLSSFLVGLAREDRADRFRILRISTDPHQTLTEYVQTPVSLDVEASFPSIGKFLERLEDSPVLAEIESMEIYRLGQDLKKCSARIKLLNYVVKR